MGALARNFTVGEKSKCLQVEISVHAKDTQVVEIKGADGSLGRKNAKKSLF